MKKIYLLLAILTGNVLLCQAQITQLHSNLGGPMGASMGNRVVFVDGESTSPTFGHLFGTDGTVPGTVSIPPATVIFGGENAALLNNKIVFLGYNSASGVELWTSDGTVAGTTIIKDIYPGPSNSDPAGGDESFVVINNTLYFTADDGTNGRELWKTDGTSTGTVMVKDLNANAIDFPFTTGTSIGNILFFTVTTSANGKELWKTDGTDAGTGMVKDITTGTGSTTFSNSFGGNGTHVFFIADDGLSGPELWRTDGTDAGTILLQDITPGAVGSFDLNDPNWRWNFHFHNNILYTNPSNGAKLYSSNGTPAGTTLLIDLNPGGGGHIDMFSTINKGNKFFFSANGDLYSSDGTGAGTTIVKNINPGMGSANVKILIPVENFANDITAGLFAGGRFFLTADDGTNGQELWISDGTEAGTTMVKDINPGAASSLQAFDHPMYLYTKYRLYIAANNGTNGYELWETDGTEAGTTMVSDIYAGSTDSDIEFYGVANITKKLVFRANNSDGIDVYSLDAPVIPFPLTLITFNAQKQENSVQLNWTTQQEVNFSHFNLQRSITGNDFITIAKINRKGGVLENNYTYNDQPNKPGIYFYRLHMVDKDGKSTFSKIVSVSLRSAFSINAVVTRDEAIVTVNDAVGPITVKLMDMNGKLYSQQYQKLITGELVRIPIGHLSSGMYIIVVESNGVIKTQQIIR